MYKSPIEIIMGEAKKNMEDNVVKVVQGYDIIVDKGELLKALEYDRRQYEKGFVEGYNMGKQGNPSLFDAIYANDEVVYMQEEEEKE